MEKEIESKEKKKKKNRVVLLRIAKYKLMDDLFAYTPFHPEARQWYNE